MKFIFIAALFLLPATQAKAATAAAYGGVAVSSFTGTAIATAAQMDGAFGVSLCNESSTGTVRCGYDVSVSTVAGSATLGFPVLKGTCVYRAVSNIIYCVSEVAAQLTYITREVFR